MSLLFFVFFWLFLFGFDKGSSTGSTRVGGFGSLNEVSLRFLQRVVLNLQSSLKGLGFVALAFQVFVFGV